MSLTRVHRALGLCRHRRRLALPVPRVAAASQRRAGATLAGSPAPSGAEPGPPPPPPPPVTATAERQAEARRILLAAAAAAGPRQDWTRAEISAIYYQPLLELVHHAGNLHRRFHRAGEVQLCTLMNIKTGGCSEDCSYCAQATRYQAGTGLAAQRMASVESVLAAARRARDRGSTRFCMGAAWRDMRGRRNSLANVVAMVKGVRELGLETCVTLGMIDGAQAGELKRAGLTAYNHNVDTSREFYPSVVSTRSYDERLQTLAHVRAAGVSVCSGGILGLGESSEDRVGLLHTVATLPAHPESFPVNALVPIRGTPLADAAPLAFTAMLRTLATARLLMPRTTIRIAAGRHKMAEEKQALCFAAGANAVFTGDKMLTTDCNGWDEDAAMFARWGLTAKGLGVGAEAGAELASGAEATSGAETASGAPPAAEAGGGDGGRDTGPAGLEAR